MTDSLTAAQTAASGHTRLNKLLLVLALLPMLLIAGVINQYGVNVPYGDEWSNFLLIEKWDAQQLTFADFYRAHNGHRIVVPRLIYLTLTHLTHGNLRAEMFFSLFLGILSSAGLYLLLRRTVGGSTTKHLTLWALINLFLFSPIQAENWLWGFQLQIFLSNLCLVGAIVCITSDAGVLPRFAGTLMFALAGTFSFGNGLLIWPAVVVVLFCRREKLSILAAWIATAMLVGLIYLPDYPAREPTPAATQWFDYLLYFAGFLGAPLARIPNSKPLVLPVLFGSILVVAYVWMAARLIRRREALRTAAPWLALGAYVIASAIMAAAARIHSGAVHSLDSRYTTVSLVLLVSLIGLMASMLAPGQNAAPSRPVGRNMIVGAVVVSLLGLYAINVPFELRYLRLHRSFRERGRGALEFSSVLDLDRMCRAALLIRQDPATLARCLSVIDRLKLTDPPRRQTLVLHDAEDRPKRATDEYGVFESFQEHPDTLDASGWSYLPGEGRPPASVVLAYRSGEEWKAFALSETTQPRPDLAAKYGSPRYLNRGWTQSFPRSSLPTGVQEISAWALNANRGETYRLQGSFELQK